MIRNKLISWFKPKRSDLFDRYNEIAVKNSLIELFVYIIFLIIATIVIFSNSNYLIFYLNNVIERLFIHRPIYTEQGTELIFDDMVTIEDLWSFMENPFLDILYGHNRNLSENDESLVSFSEDFITNLIIIRQPRLRQIRVRNMTCDIHERFQRYFRNCFGKYSYENEEVSSNHLGSKYLKNSEGGGIGIWGQIAYYRGGGFIENFKNDLDYNKMLLTNLRNGNWIDQATRAIFIEFALYNVNLNLICVIRLIIELPPTGGIVPSYTIRTLTLNLLQEDYGIFICWIIFTLLIIYYCIEELIELFYDFKTYIKSLWNLLDLIIIMMGYLLIAFALWSQYYIKTYFTSLDNNVDNLSIRIDTLDFWQFQNKNMAGILMFLMWIKIFKYIAFNKTMLQFSTTLYRCASDLLGFGLMFLIVFIAFSQFGYLIFGTEIYGFRTFTDSIFTMMRTILGDFEYLPVEKSNRILGPLFFLTYIFFVFFVLLNMFLAIINDTYSEVKSEENLDNIHIIDYLKRKFNKLCKHLCCCCYRSKRQFVSSNENDNFDDNNGINVNKESSQTSQENNNSNLRNRRPLIVRESRLIGTIFEIVEPDSNAGKQSEEIKSLEERIRNLEVLMDKIILNLDSTVDRLDKLRQRSS